MRERERERESVCGCVRERKMPMEIKRMYWRVCVSESGRLCACVRDGDIYRDMAMEIER